MPRPTQLEIEKFLESYGLPTSTRTELIEITENGKFQFYMIAFKDLKSTHDGWQEDISLAVYWPKTTEAAPTHTELHEQLRLF